MYFRFFLLAACLLCSEAALNAQTSTLPTKQNSYDFAQSVSELILGSMEEQQAKLKPKQKKEYKTDQERLTNLTSAKQKEIADFILAITTLVDTQVDEENEIFIFCDGKSVKTDQALIVFLDGKCVGVGSVNKALFTSLPKDKYGQGIYNLQFYLVNGAKKALFETRVNFSLKNDYRFKWNKNTIVRSN